MKKRTRKTQEGSVLLEALIAVIIFSIGILGLVALLARTTAGVTDTRQRDEVFLLASNAFDQVQILNLNDVDISSTKDATGKKELGSDAKKQVQLQLQQFKFGSKTVAPNNAKNCANKQTTKGGTVYTNTISYGVLKAGENKGTERNVVFCAYHDTGPVR